MGSVKVTVYGRVKPCLKNCRSHEYQLKYGDHQDQITFANKISSGKKTYRFKKIFAENASQEEIFETVAKPIIKSVLTGYNGTIFTYGQTGSGKTYTMTGDIEQWINPGLIPRTVQEIFKQKSRDTPISITYCEIYNEHVYDLIRLDPDLPQVNLLEDSSGITHFRNLSVHLVGSVFEALQLLIRGDANKMVAETNNNARSSRSHVIFSIGLEFPHPTEEKLCLKPVLYLVDLAGSEKLSKCKTPMTNPLETRYINLSLHYLEQVLIALRQPGRNHIPYRNSLMTALLRNSLGGNCITAMIATFSLALDDMEETMQTCRFAERIALIKNEVKLNELIDPQKEILLLKRENDKLRAQLRIVNTPQEKFRLALIKNEVKVNELIDPQKEILLLKKESNKLRAQLRIVNSPQAMEELTEKERRKCVEMVQNFIKGNDIFDLPLCDLKRVEYCFRVMRDEILKNEVKDPPVKKSEKSNDVLDILKKNSSTLTRDFYLETKLTEENRVKIIESSGGRKRTPMDLPKINLTYKRWKSTQQISDNECVMLKKFSSKELKMVDSNASESVYPSRKLRNMNSDSSLRKLTEGEPPPENEKPDAYLIDGCFLKVGSSEISSRHNSSVGLKFQGAEKSVSLVTTEVSSVFMRNDFPGAIHGVSSQSPASSEEKLTYGEIRKLISVGIQVEDKTSVEAQSACGLSINSNAESSSIHSLDAGTFSGKSLPLTGDSEVDEEILKFYKARYLSLKKN